MKTIFITFIFSVFLNQVGISQGRTSASMRVSATIISGSTLETVELVTVGLNSKTDAVGRIKFVTTKHVEAHVETSSSAQMINQYGDMIELSTDSLHEAENGRHSVDIKATIETKLPSGLKGTYKGTITSTINYL